MKNSLFKRALATVAAVPLALTQSLTYSFAADTDSAPETASVSESEASGSSKNYDLDSLLYIKPSLTVLDSEWNLTLSGVLDQLVQDGQTKGNINTEAVFNAAINNAGQFKDLAKAVLGEVKDAKYEIVNGDVVVTAKVGSVTKALSDNFKNSFGSLSANLAEKYNAPELANIKFEEVKTSGAIKVVFGTSQLSLETKVPVTFTFTPDETGEALGPDATLNYIADKLGEVKATAKSAIDKVPGIDKAAAYKDVDNEVGRFENYLKRGKNALAKAMTFKRSGNYATMADFLKAANSFANKKINRSIPSSAAEIAGKSAVLNAFNDVLNQVNNAVKPTAFNFNAPELGAYMDKNVKEIAFSADGAGTTVFEAKIPDAEGEQVAALFADNATTDYEDSYKIVKVTLDTTKLDDQGVSVDLSIKRVIVTKAKTTTTSTTSTTTTTTTTTTSSTSSTTSTTTTYVYSSEFQGVYADIDATYGFYTNLDEAFSAKQVSGLEIHSVYNDIRTDEKGNSEVYSEHSGPVVDAKMTFGFGDKTPANVYDPTVKNFKYEIPVIYTGEDILAEDGTTVIVKKGDPLKDSKGNDVTVTAYIGIKGDANLDGKLSAVDASYVLVFAADLQVVAGEEAKDPQTVVLSKQSELVANDPAGIYDNFAAFLADVKNEINPLHAWKTGKGSLADGTSRAFNSVDASYILVANANLNEGNTMAEAWSRVLGK